jgi:hypothetical protein
MPTEPPPKRLFVSSACVIPCADWQNTALIYRTGYFKPIDFPLKYRGELNLWTCALTGDFEVACSKQPCSLAESVLIVPSHHLSDVQIAPFMIEAFPQLFARLPRPTVVYLSSRFE